MGDVINSTLMHINDLPRPYSTLTRHQRGLILTLYDYLCQLYFKFVFNFNDTPVSNTRTLPVNIYFNDTLVNSTRTLPVNILTCAWKTEKPCKLQYNSLTVFWLVSL